MNKNINKPRKARKYTDEFVREAIKLALGSSVSSAAKDLGIPSATLHTWMKNLAQNTNKKGSGDVTAEEIIEQNIALAQKISQVNQKIAILRKDIADLYKDREPK